MKQYLLIIVATLVLAVTTYAQSTGNSTSTNAAPVVTQPVANTVTTYTPGKITAPAALTTQLVGNYFSPMLSTVGLTVPSGAVTQTFTVTFYSDGSSRSVATFVASGKLPSAPAH